MDTGIIILLIILFIGTLCVVFQRPLVDFLFRYCSLGSLLDKLNNAFLSRDEKECLKQEREFRNASPEELRPRWLAILDKFAGKYPESQEIPESLRENLPQELADFFSEYDFLKIGEIALLDKRALASVKVGGQTYIVIGKDEPDDTLFVIRLNSMKTSSCPVFAIDPDLDCAENLNVNTRPESGYRSIRNFVCLMSLYYGENNDSE